VILRENIGYDFMSYQAGIHSLDCSAYDQLVVCNDSVYGPFFDLAAIFQEMDSRPGVDFWGMTSNNDIAYHLQSYFMVFNRQVLLSDTFQRFWQDVRVLESKREIIRQYEVGLSQSLTRAEFTASVYAEYRVPIGSHLLAMAKRFSPAKVIDKLRLLLTGENIVPRVNVSHFHWKELLLEERMPFLKIELLRDNPMNIDIADYQQVINDVSNYDCDLIRNHLARITVHG
jgi:rhamnosyltransferase